MILGPVGSSDWLHHPYSTEGVKSDRDAATLDPHITGPYLKSYTLDKLGDVRTNKYDTDPRISHVMMHS